MVDKPSAAELVNKNRESFNSCHRVRVRHSDPLNFLNMGASSARNAAIRESAADWLLFLDDDFIIDHELIHTFLEIVVEHGHTAVGFIAATLFPEPVTAKNSPSRSHSLLDTTIIIKRDSCVLGVTAKSLHETRRGPPVRSELPQDRRR